MRLLLTVVDLAEVEVALAAGAGVVDVKDPERGSLGRPAPELVAAVAGRLGTDRGTRSGSAEGGPGDGRPAGGRGASSPAPARGSPPWAELSVPLGDGPHDPAEAEEAARFAAACGARYVKLGLLGHGGPASSGALLRRVRAAVARACPGAAGAGGRRDGAAAEVVAVTFADAPAGQAPSPLSLLDVARSAGARRVMLDTLRKSTSDLLSSHGRGRLGRWAREARRRGLGTALAGGLDARSLRRLAGLGVDVVGVRGGACGAGDRTGQLDPERCRRLAAAVAAGPTDRPESSLRAAPPSGG